MANGKKFEGVARELIALRIANEIPDGSYANLGIGIPTLVSNWIEGRDIVLEAEIGMLNCGPLAFGDDIDQDLINASCQPITEMPGSCYFCSSESFAMIRGGFMDYAVMGALQVAENGDYAGWNIPSSGRGKIGNIGGSMDLAVGARNVFIAMEHVTVTGEPKLLKSCTYPLTAKKCVKKVFTNLSVIDVTPQGFVLREVAPGLTAEDVQSVTEAKLIIAEDLKEMAL
ncbi:MAG: 3-oxoacid CoA-transferase family, subunit [Chloroflexi bacterium]|jgi:3-oxoacid CoA-transferase B subunit|nr:3-oxoacid CoA-transferase family, subunit [Chloroflexota bacterium]